MDTFPTPETWLTHRVSYGETDAMSVMYYAEYLHLFERSRSEYIREHGMSYSEVEKRGIYLPVREAKCRYKRPARFDDLLHLRVGISKWGRASMTFEYEIYNESKDTVLATGSTEHACTNEKGRPVKVPEWLKDLFLG
ncbi:thioesterase family protein [Halodesulfovibrio sp.]|jgi:acyl-CoA thioester hydrolase|uniref:acyl-CoA thioesterase n=1 Tax=Halodesulfovibrio sp. TaxID=1912772 RepID=UPI0025EEE8FB|nr:thioesterase family protein [Halodesulfovibrio sp.]MCT4626310.1 acyl-CoA thioesterase [Halodesulfovibrio sp.]